MSRPTEQPTSRPRMTSVARPPQAPRALNGSPCRAVSLLVTFMAAAAIAVGACNAARTPGAPSGPVTSPVAPTTSRPGVPALVAGPPSRFTRVTITAAARHAAVPGPLLTALAPLLIARDFGQSKDLASFGLDRPQATLHYEAANGAVVDVQIGAPDFDRHGVYAMRDGDLRVYMVLADAVRPVLALVGITLAPPSN